MVKTVLDVSDRQTIVPVAELELSRTEDSVSSLANLATRDGLIALAGINSSTADQKAGKNEHLRAFEIRYPPRKKQKTEKSEVNSEGSITALGKRSFFKPSSSAKEQTYQRLLRLSPARKNEGGNKRIGAIATGLAQEAQVIVFNATVAPPENADIIAKIDLPSRSEAADLDIIQTEESDYSLVYCDDYSIYEQTFRYDFKTKKVEKRPNGPRRVTQIPLPDTLQDPKSRPKFRCVRYLNDLTVLALVNKANKKGTELWMYHLYPTGPAMELSSRSLPANIKQAASMDVCILDADEFGNQQVVIAVAGQDVSISVFTANYSSSTETFSSLRSYLTMHKVHDQGMTQICFEPFHSPKRAVDPAQQKTTGDNGEPLNVPSTASQHPGPQYIRLASVSYANTVVVETFPLSPLEPKNKDSRYVLSHPQDESFYFWAYAIVISVVVLVTAFLLQAFINGDTAAEQGLLGVVPAPLREILGQPVHSLSAPTHRSTITVQKASSASIIETILPSLSDAHEPAAPSPVDAPTDSSTIDLRAALAEHHATPEGAEAVAVVVRDAPEGEGIDITVHPDKMEYLEGDSDAKHWHELEDHAKDYWKAKLKAAGQWAEAEGEAVFKGVLWSSYAGFVGQVAGEIIREL